MIIQFGDDIWELEMETLKTFTFPDALEEVCKKAYVCGAWGSLTSYPSTVTEEQVFKAAAQFYPSSIRRFPTNDPQTMEETFLACFTIGFIDTQEYWREEEEARREALGLPEDEQMEYCGRLADIWYDGSKNELQQDMQSMKKKYQ